MRRLSLVLIVLLCSFTAVAQTNRATLTGVVMDAAQEVVVGAKISLTESNTGIVRESLANDSGVYTFSSLPLGQYTLTVAANGFDTKKFAAFALDVGQTRTLNVTLNIGKVSEEVNVVATPDLTVNTAEVGGIITDSQLLALPVNGRYLASLEAQIPGAISSGTGTQDSIRFSGLSQEDNNFRLDGVDSTGINHQYEKAALVVQFPMESIAEFKGGSALYSADKGGMAGGQIDMASKAGTNLFHGSFYEYLRNNYFDAKAFGTTAVSPFKLNNFGISSGGPILRNKLFYFANYEAVRQRYNQPFNAYVPTSAYRQQVVQASSALASLVNAFPTGTKSTSDPNALLWYSSGANPTDENGGLGRVDYTMSDKTTMYFRFNTDDYTMTSPGMAENTTTTYHTPNATFDVAYRISPSILNDAKVGYNRQAYQDVGVGATSAYTLTISPNFTYSLGDHSWRIDNSYSVLDDAIFSFHKHNIKSGIQITAFQENKLHPITLQSLSYLSEANFVSNVLDSYSYTPPGVETAARKKNYYGYVLDEFKLRPNLTLNAGLRYEYYGVDSEVHPSIGQIFDPFTCGLQYCAVGSSFYSPNYLGFEPRISIGWAPKFLHDKTAIRAGFGSSVDDGQFGGLYALQTQIGQAFSLSQSTVKGLSYPVTPYVGSAKSNLTYSAMDRNRRNLQVNQWTLSIQHEVIRNTILQATYVGSKGTHLFNKNLLLNGINPSTGTRPYASLTSATIGWTTWVDNSNYNALQVGIKRNMYHELLVSANYQYAHTISDGSNGGGESDGAENNNCRSCERASTDFDVRHNLTASAIWTLPLGRGQLFLNGISPLANGLIGGWQFSGIGVARTGVPLNVTMSRSASALPDGINSNQRPDRVPGVSLYTAHRSASQWLNPAAFATPANGAWGNASRNAVRAPGISQADVALQKQFPLWDRVKLSFRSEVFNVFNFDQIGKPVVKWTSATGTYGQITSAYTTNPVGTGTPRQMQFSLRLSY